MRGSRYPKLTAIVGLCLMWGVLGYAQDSLEQWFQSGVVTDRLHGFSVKRPQGWSVAVQQDFIRISDEEALHFIIVRFARHKGTLEEVLQARRMEHQTLRNGLTEPRFAIRKLAKGYLIVGEGLGYPYRYHPMMAVNFGLLGKTPPQNYREITLILSGQKTALVASLLFPEGTSRQVLDQMLVILKSFSLLPKEQWVLWRQEVIRDPEVGGNAGVIHVPQGFEYQGQIVKQGTKRMPFLMIRKGDILFRMDNIDIASMGLQSGFGSSARTVVTVNGQSAQVDQLACVRSAEEIAEFLIGLWNAETGKEWTLKASRRPPVPKSYQEMAASDPMASLDLAAQREHYMLAFTAHSGPLARTALVNAIILNTQQVDWVAGTQCHAGMMVTTFQYPQDRERELQGLFAGVQNSFYLDPRAALSAVERFTQENRELNRMVREMLNKEREFNSQMARTWTNALSDQTYVKDPETNEVFRVHKNVWESGEFWRDPVWKTVVGTVERDSALEDLLKTEGWRLLKQSLDGTFKNE